eukprot:12268713-Alexandrium_andersonii.AAC.1
MSLFPPELQEEGREGGRLAGERPSEGDNANAVQEKGIAVTVAARWPGRVTLRVAASSSLPSATRREGR